MVNKIKGSKMKESIHAVRILGVLGLIVAAFVSTIPIASGAKFLASLFHPLSQASHNAFVGRITRGLVSRGHTVTVLAADTHDFKGLQKDISSTRIVTFKTDGSSSAMEDIANTKLSKSQDGDNWIETVRLLMAVGNIGKQNCADMFNDDDVMNDLRKEKFELLLVEMFVPCDALLAEYLKVPFIVMTSSFRFPAFDEDLYNLEIPSSYVPLSLGAFTDEMTFVQRAQNFVGRHVIGKILQHMSFRSYRDIQLQHDIATTSSMRELIGRAELWLCHVDFALEFPHPTAPNWVMFAGLTVSEGTKQLQEDLEDFVQGSGENGVVVFSLGSTKMNLLSEETIETFAQVFRELPARVIWKYDGPVPRNLGNNTRQMPWIPQADLLAHPHTKLLVYHGGLAGVYEALRFQKPMVLLPLFADQPAVAVRVAKKGMGVVLSKSNLTVEAIKSAIHQVLNDPSYKSNVERYGSISKDTIASPLDTALFWIEHIVKFGGSHLKSRAGEMNLISRNSIDVISFIFAMIMMALYVEYLIIHSCYRCLCRNRNKSKSD
nr:UDP-glucuronosyltransferase 2B33-like [Lytechinus pictus]